jgi:hypothetical protein
MKDVIKLIVVWVLLTTSLFLLSCSSSRKISKQTTGTDSTRVHVIDSMLQIYRIDSAGWANMIEMLSENTIIFQDTGSTRTVIEYYPDGNIKKVEGDLKTVTAKFNKSLSETYYWKSRYDSLAQHSSKDSVRYITQTVTVNKNTKTRVLPWWIWIVCAGVLIVGWRLGKIK